MFVRSNDLSVGGPVVYVSAKTEQLTARGVESIADPLTSLSSVKRAIVDALYGTGDVLGPHEEESDFRW